MVVNNSNVNKSYFISSIVKTFIFVFIIGFVIYFLKSSHPDMYDKYIYSLITGKKINVITSDVDQNNTYVQTEETFEIYDTTTSEEKDNRVVVSSVKTSSERKIVDIIENKVSSVVNKVVDEIIPNSTPEKNSTPKFIDGFEVITIEDTEPYELSENSSSSVTQKQNINTQKSVAQLAQVQQEVVYVEPEIPEDYDGPNWAVVAVNTEIYSKEKKKVGSILGGIVVETNGHMFMKNSTLIQCFQIKDGVVNREVEFYVKESDLVMFRGPYTTQLHPDKTTIIEFCTLRGKYQSLLDNLRKEEIKKNPHYADYQEAVNAYKALKLESDELEEKRKSTSGAAKANLEDRIHKLKLEEVTARKTLNDAQRKYDSWRNTNLGADDDIKITPTPELNKLKRQMDALHPRANEICPGI